MKRSLEAEMMDLPGNPKELLVEDLAHLRSLNRYFKSAIGAVRRGLRQQIVQHHVGENSLLDVGTGSGDIPLAIVAWARQNGIAATIVGLEIEAITLARPPRRRPVAGRSPRARRRRCAAVCAALFDFVLASQLPHHFSEIRL